MQARQFDREELEELLTRSEEREPPPWLLPRVMAEIEERQPSLGARLWRWWTRPQAVHFSPARLVSTMAVTLCAFWLGFAVGHNPRPGAGTEKAILTGPGASGEANYLIGRGLLAGGQADQALPFLRQAVRQEPKAAEFVHWQGVAYGALGQAEAERESYLASVEEDPQYLPALLNLGHSYLESGQYRQALALYDRVLQGDAGQPSALYNRALACQMLGDPAGAEQAYLAFLAHHRTGKWAWRALGHLHRLGNFTFRSYPVGAARLILDTKALLNLDPDGRRQEVLYLAEALSRAPGSELHLVAYHQGDRRAARAVVGGLQEQLTAMLGGEHPLPVMGSWFDAAETFTDANGVDRQSPAGLRIFTRPQQQSNQTNSI